MNDPEKILYLECSCHSPEHMLKFSLDREYKDLYTEIQLIHCNNFFKRLWLATKYVLGYRCKWGHWDCWLLKKDDASRLIELLQEYIQLHNEGESKNGIGEKVKDQC